MISDQEIEYMVYGNNLRLCKNVCKYVQYIIYLCGGGGV